ncbi:hypothetical protein [Vagococcus jeotgali]|uniref:hypothetical protein n=1 Tax=Vagococcus jeotgali TaxID=3109030 RepID=UPI002DD9598E|nr:hypothetical protein [Vagococcus sp. B2T-5]
MMKRLWLVLATCLLFLNLIWIYHTYQYDAYTQAVGEITTIQVLSQTDTKDEHHNTD